MPKHTVKYSLGWTQNMGDFQSLRVDVGLEVEGDGSPTDTMQNTQKWVEKRLEERLKAVIKEIESGE